MSHDCVYYTFEDSGRVLTTTVSTWYSELLWYLKSESPHLLETSQGKARRLPLVQYNKKKTYHSNSEMG